MVTARAVDTLYAELLMDERPPESIPNWLAVAKAILRIPVNLVTDGMAELGPRCAVLVREVATHEIVLRHDLGRSTEAGYADLEDIRRALDSMSRKEFRAEYGIVR